MLTKSQQSRRQRMLDSALKLAGAGGYDAVQMREVAADADVALGTLYRYFPSKDHLLVSAMLDQIEQMRERLASRPPAGDTPAGRVFDVLSRATRAFTRQRDVTTAMLRALLSAEHAMAELVGEVRTSMTAIITQAMHTGDPTPCEVDAARTLEYAWMGSLVSWLNGLNTGQQVLDDLDAAVKLLVGAPAVQ